MQPVREKSGSEYPPVIVLGVGVTALGALRILARDGLKPIVANGADPLLRSSRWYRPVPVGNPALGDRPLADWLPELQFDQAVLMPCSDHRVSEVAALPEAIRARFPASVPTAHTLELFVDKAKFAETLQSTGVPHPFSKSISTAVELDDVPDRLFTSAMLKPRDSQSFMRHFGVKALTVGSRREAADQLARVNAAGFGVILQEYIPGPATEHYFVDGFVDRNGEIRAIFVRRRLRMYPLDFGNSTAMVSIDVDEGAPAVASIKALLGGVHYRGIFSAEFKRDERDGAFKILEVNTRPWWYVDFAARCGVDVCRMAYEDALERPVATIQRYATGRPMVFPYHDYFACKALRSTGELSFARWMGSWFGAMQPVFQFQDPAPGMRAFFKTMVTFFANRVSRLLPVFALFLSRWT